MTHFKMQLGSRADVLALHEPDKQQQKRQLFGGVWQTVLGSGSGVLDETHLSSFSFSDEDDDPLALLYLEPGAIADPSAAPAQVRSYDRST